MLLGHVLAVNDYEPGAEYIYYWGSGWSKYGFEKAEDWTNYLKDYAEKVRNPLGGDRSEIKVCNRKDIKI